MELTEKKCEPCEGGMPSFTQEQIDEFLPKVQGWEVIDGKLHREFKFKNFAEAGAWLDKVRVLADEENHHPDIHWYYNKIVIELWTHAVDGLSENDFILAAKMNKITE